MLNDMNKIENAAKWSKERLDAELEKGYNDMLNGSVTPWNDIYAKFSEAISKNKNGTLGVDAEEFVKFNDGYHFVADFESVIKSDHRPIVQQLADVNTFKDFTLQAHSITWPNGVDFAPEFIKSLG